jgi:hypothetical protein
MSPLLQDSNVNNMPLGLIDSSVSSRSLRVSDLQLGSDRGCLGGSSSSLRRRRYTLSKSASIRSGRKIISSHAVQSIKESIGFAYSSVPWYCKKRVVFQISELRKRLEFLSQDSFFLRHGMILPSSVPSKLQGRYQSKVVERQPENSMPCKTSNRRVRFSGFKKNLSSKGGGSSIGAGQKDEKENNQVMAKISKKRLNVLRVLTGKNKEKPVQNTSKTRSSSSSWFVRPDSSPKNLPAYCSMELISFDKDSECFHRTEIVYPFRPSVAANQDENGTVTSSRRLAKKVEIRTAAVNNIYKHSLILE